METIRGSVYDYPKYYDVLFAADWKAEFAFLSACFDEHARRPVWRLFEPACGTGRLLMRFAKAGFTVSGNDLNPKAVDYCNQRLARHGFPATAVVGDMSDFRVRRKQDAAFNTINSFCHLDSEAKARAHLECVARALGKGGIYMLGFHLMPTRGGMAADAEKWSARRGHLSIQSQMRSVDVDLGRRRQLVTFTLDVKTPSRQFRLADEFPFRTYTAAQFRRLLASVPSFELVETYDFGYDIDQPVEICPRTEDVIYVLRKR
jgi:hypothetical protein